LMEQIVSVGSILFLADCVFTTKWFDRNVPCPTIVPTGTVAYSFQLKSVISAWSHLAAHGVPADACDAGLAEVELKSLAGEQFACPCAAQVLLLPDPQRWRAMKNTAFRKQ
jgi:hypothetical protein